MIGPWQRIHVNERGAPDPLAVTEVSEELVLELAKRLGIPMELLGGTGFDRDTLERILGHNTRNKTEAHENRERPAKSHGTTSDTRGKEDDSRCQLRLEDTSGLYRLNQYRSPGGASRHGPR